ncbi:P27 family phage terminase small subunit [Nocardiopsis sediminis]|uniref:P27 family phage terminase small subunit n=1 Tax=Nocardiopsis sediminis TaxID=1778267 RepID=A0ABV8FK51_9ACTN
MKTSPNSTPSDRHQLHAYVDAVRLHAQAPVLVQRAGQLIKDGDGGLRTNPDVRIQRESSRTILFLAREFGLMPAARVGLANETVYHNHAARLLG